MATNLLDDEQSVLHVLNIQEVPLAADKLGRAAAAPADNAEELMQSSGNTLIEQACHAAQIDHGRVKSIVHGGHPAKEVVSEAQRLGVDAIVMGSRGNSNIQSLVIGSVSHRVMHVAPCSVVIVS